MAKKTNLTEILTNGTPKQKALLIIKHEEEKQRLGNVTTLTAKEAKAIIDSIKKGTEEERKEYNRYIDIADIYATNRLHLFALQENLYKFTARIYRLLNLWEQAEKEAELFNTLLSELYGKLKDGDYKKIKSFIYNQLLQWNRNTPIRQVEGKAEVEADLSYLRRQLDREVWAYAHALSVAKAFVEASDKFQQKERATAFIPEDIKTLLRTFTEPNLGIPEIYRRDSYLKLVREKGKDDREVKFMERYAILPAYEEVQPIQDNNLKELFKL